jgi:hypothetical protein
MILERGFLSFEPLFHDVDVFFRVSVGNQLSVILVNMLTPQ